MQVAEAIAKRSSIRDYKETAVPEDKLSRVLEAARLAPTGANSQNIKFVVVRNKEARRRLMRASGNQRHVGQAPVIIAAVATAPEVIMECGVPAYPVDAAIAVDHMTLAAVEEGLGTCWIGFFDQETARDILRVPDRYMIAALITLGYTAGPGNPKNRKPLDQRVCYDTFKE
jgi:nitroreductase